VNSPEVANVGAAIRSLRLTKGLTIKQLAERAGLHEVYLGRIETGHSGFCLGVFTKLAAALDVGPGALLEKKPPDLSPGALAFGRTFDAAPSDLTKPLLAVLRVMASARAEQIVPSVS
jgi:transcriptional regulator with XRE-family HTH domain